MPEQSIVDTWRKNIEMAKSNPSVWFDSLDMRSKTDCIANDHVIKVIDAYIQYSQTNKLPSTLTGRRVFSECYDVRIPISFGRLITNACQSAQFNLVEQFRLTVESYAKSKAGDNLNSEALYKHKQWSVERELVTAVLSSYDSRLYSIHNLYYNDIPPTSWKAGQYKELVYTDTARAFYHIMSSDNQYWKLDQQLGMDCRTVSTQKKRFTRNRRKAGADVVTEHLYQRVLADKTIMKHWFQPVIDEDTRLDTVERWRKSLTFKWEVQSEMERVIWMTEMNKQLESTLDRMI